MEKSKIDLAKKYLIHCAGIYTMLAWIEEQNQLGTGSSVSKQIIYVPPLASRYFSLGISRHKKAKLPFLAIQPNESSWMKMITWDKIYIRRNDRHLYLVSSSVKGDEVEFPDIPPFVLAITFDTWEKLQLLSGITHLDGREYYQDDNGQIQINYHARIFNLGIKFIEEHDNIIAEEKLKTYRDILLDKEKELQSVYSTAFPPEFKGDLSESALAGIKDGNSGEYKIISELYDKIKKKWI